MEEYSLQPPKSTTCLDNGLTYSVEMSQRYCRNSALEQPPRRVEYIVEYDYDAVHEDELTIRVGEIIKNVRKLEEEGWMEGEVHGRRGMFPDNFVKENKKDAELRDENVPIKREKPGNVASLVQRMSTYGLPPIGIQPHPQTKNVKKKAKKRQCKVLFDYAPQNEDELELKVGEVVDINEEVEEGWWSGTLNGKSGLFPSNFVKEIELPDDFEMHDGPEDAVSDSGLIGTTSPGSPVLSPGNGFESVSQTQPKKIRGVGFGDIFKEGSVKLKPRISSSDSEDKKQEKTLPTQPTGPRISQSLSTEVATTETDGKSKAKEYCRAIFSYEGSNEDELSFKEGDTITLLSKDTGDVGWWKGELNGKEGVFPDNFAAIIIQDAEKDKPKKPPPPVKSTAPKPELRVGDKKGQPPRLEEKDERASFDQKTTKPVAPQVPPKKPMPPSKAPNLLKQFIPPKRPDKPALPTPLSKPNGEVPLIRPKSEMDSILKPKSDLETLRPKSIDIGSYPVKSLKETELMSFDDVMPTSENLSHPTANRPKMHGKRLPGRFNGSNSPIADLKDVSEVPKEDDVDSAKPKPSDVKKPLLAPSTPLIHHSMPSLPPFTTPVSTTPRANSFSAFDDMDDGKKNVVDDLKDQISELLMIVEALKKEHGKELEKIKRDLEEEKVLRSNLESEIEKLKKLVQST